MTQLKPKQPMAKTDGLTLLFSQRNKVFALIALGLLSGCATEHPNVDLVLAREAYTSATEVDAAKYSPANFHYAEEAYRKAMRLYTKGEYREAITQFRLAREYSERAENTARVQRQKSGEEAL